jgi:hypothetical protein
MHGPRTRCGKGIGQRNIQVDISCRGSSIGLTPPLPIRFLRVIA